MNADQFPPWGRIGSRVRGPSGIGFVLYYSLGDETFTVRYANDWDVTYPAWLWEKQVFPAPEPAVVL